EGVETSHYERRINSGAGASRWGPVYSPVICFSFIGERRTRCTATAMTKAIARFVKADVKLDGYWRFAIAYNAALQCAAMALNAAVYQVPKGGGTHYHTIESLKLTIGDDGTLVDPLQAFRSKRGGGIYETTGVASETEIEELRASAKSLQARVLDWLKAHHP